MVLLIGIGFAKPVPADPRKFNTRYGILLVAAAGPAMNLLLAIITINLYAIGLKLGFEFFQTQTAFTFFTTLALINMLLMLFNLLPIGPLDGSYILPYALPAKRRFQVSTAECTIRHLRAARPDRAQFPRHTDLSEPVAAGRIHVAPYPDRIKHPNSQLPATSMKCARFQQLQRQLVFLNRPLFAQPQ